MKTSSFFLAALLCICLSCKENASTADQNNSTDTQLVIIDTLSFQKKSIIEKNCINQGADTLCAKVDIEYISVEQGFNPESVMAINTYLQNAVSGDSMSIGEEIANFLISIKEFEEESPEYWPSFYELVTQQEVNLNNKYLFTGNTLTYQYMGGAHGIYYTENFNFSTQTGERLDWRTLFTDTLAIYDLAAKKLAEGEEDKQLAEGETIMDYYDFTGGEFYLPENFLLSDQHIEFLYTVYEIASYAEGEITISLPYEQIEKYLTPDTPLANFIKASKETE